MSEKRTAVCLASSFLGHYAHSGFLNELDRGGLRPSRIAGASAGALAGGLWAGGLRGEALEEEICDIDFRRAFGDWGFLLRLPGLLTWSYANGLLGGGRMRRRLMRLLGGGRLEELRAPSLEIAVANLSRRAGEIRTHGPLVELIVASISMPVVYRARRIDGDWLADGGVSNETPYAHWLEDETIDRIVIHRIRFPARPTERMRLGGVLAACHAIPNRELEDRRRRDAERCGKEVIFLTTELPQPPVFHRACDGRRMIEAGRATARKWMTNEE